MKRPYELIGQLLLAVPVCVGLAISALPLSAAAEELPKVIRISTGTGSALAPGHSGGTPGVTIGLRTVEDEFAADGVKIEWLHVVGGGVATNEALASKAVDIGFAGDFPALNGRAGNLKTRFIGGGFRGGNCYLVVAPKLAAKSLADLKGKRIAIAKGQPWEYGFDNLLRSQGFTQRDFEIVNLSVVDARDALKRGQVDAVYSIGVYALTLDDTGEGRIIWSTRNAPKDWQVIADYFVADDFAQRYPTAVKRFLKAVVRANAWAAEPNNAEALYRLWLPLGYPVDSYRKEYGGTDVRFRNSPIPDEFLLNHYRQAAEYMYANKLIRRKVDVDVWVDRSFIDAALAETGLTGYWPEYDKDGRAKTPPAAISAPVLPAAAAAKAQR